MAEIKKLLDDAIETEINNLNSASDKDEKSEVIKNLAALHKLRIEEIKTETEIEEKSERRAMDKAAHDEDATLKAFQLDENTLDRYAKIGIAAAELVSRATVTPPRLAPAGLRLWWRLARGST